MLLEFGAKNFFSFKEGFKVSMRLNSSCPEKISKNRNFSTILALKGANASGKTNVLKVLTFLRDFCRNSFNNKPNEDIEFDSYFNNSNSTNIYIVFGVDNIEYRYELELTRKKVISETIYRKDKRDTRIIDRKDNKIIYTTKEFKELKIIKLRDNTSLISTAKQYEIEEIDLFYNLFHKIGSNVYILGRNDELPDYQIASKFYNDNSDVFKFVKEVLKKSDIGIEDIQIYNMEHKETSETIYYPIFYYEVNGKENFLTFHNQSSGVKSLYQQLGFYKVALNLGAVLVLDEFDINLHPDLLPMLIDFFEDEEKNIHNAQLIFTTHNADIMDRLGKYRVAIVNKEDNESYLYRLDEIPSDMLRNDRPISPIYNAGKIGGKPKIEL